MGSLNRMNQALTSMNTARTAREAVKANEAAKAREAGEKAEQAAREPWLTSWFVQLANAADGGWPYIHARYRDLQTWATLTHTQRGWKIYEWTPFVPAKRVQRMAERAIKDNLA